MKIYYLMGKSASGKDTIYKRLLEDETLELEPIIIYTTRPMRSYEMDGREYHFVSVERMKELELSGKVIEKRSYNTVHGIWNYFTVYDEKLSKASDENFLMLGTLESYIKVRDYFTDGVVEPLYIYVEDGERLQRALTRERAQENPKFEEMCRRFMADQIDFSKEKLDEAGINKFYINDDMDKCIDEIKKVIELNK